MQYERLALFCAVADRIGSPILVGPTDAGTRGQLLDWLIIACEDGPETVDFLDDQARRDVLALLWRIVEASADIGDVDLWRDAFNAYGAWAGE